MRVPSLRQVSVCPDVRARVQRPSCDPFPWRFRQAFFLAGRAIGSPDAGQLQVPRGPLVAEDDAEPSIQTVFPYWGEPFDWGEERICVGRRDVTAADMAVMPKVNRVPLLFLRGSWAKDVDLRQLSGLREVPSGFLFHCKSLTTVESSDHL